MADSDSHDAGRHLGIALVDWDNVPDYPSWREWARPHPCEAVPTEPRMVPTPMAPKPTKKTQSRTNKRRSSLRRAVARPSQPVAPSGKRKQAGEALREHQELLAKAFRTSPHPIGITELATGRCIEVNEACLQLFGFRREEVIGNTTLSLGIWPKQEDRARLVDRLKSGEPVRDLELNFSTRSGELRHILVSADLVELSGRPCLITAGHGWCWPRPTIHRAILSQCHQKPSGHLEAVTGTHIRRRELVEGQDRQHGV